MKHRDPRLINRSRAVRETAEELYQARAKHKAMKSTFKGIMSYPQRKILFEIGKKK